MSNWIQAGEVNSVEFQFWFWIDGKRIFWPSSGTQRGKWEFHFLHQTDMSPRLGIPQKCGKCVKQNEWRTLSHSALSHSLVFGIFIKSIIAVLIQCSINSRTIHSWIPTNKAARWQLAQSVISPRNRMNVPQPSDDKLKQTSPNVHVSLIFRTKYYSFWVVFHLEIFCSISSRKLTFESIIRWYVRWYLMLASIPSFLSWRPLTKTANSRQWVLSTQTLAKSIINRWKMSNITSVRTSFHL